MRLAPAAWRLPQPALCLSCLLKEHRDRKYEQAEDEAASDHHVGGPADLPRVEPESHCRFIPRQPASTGPRRAFPDQLTCRPPMRGPAGPSSA